jgi:single-strand DNA-binding protein
MINQSTLVGRLTKDPELKYTNDGKPVANYQLAVQRPYKKDGQKPTDFISIVTWGKDGEFLANNAKKGAMVAVRGRWETRSYDHNVHPVKIYVSELNTEEVQILEWDNDGGQQQGGSQGGYSQGGYGQGYGQQQQNSGYNQGYGGGGNYNQGYGQQQGGGYNQGQQQQQNRDGQQQNNGGYNGGQQQQGGYNQGFGGGQGYGGQQQNRNAPPAAPPNNPNRGQQFNADPFANDGTPIDISDDDLPF